VAQQTALSVGGDVVARVALRDVDLFAEGQVVGVLDLGPGGVGDQAR
jgi:hypothetical protein